MRFVVRQYTNKPSKLSLAKSIAAWNTIAATGDKTLIKENVYRDPYRTPDNLASRVLDKLNIWYHQKCAYCERIYKMDVEHYRPKGEVRDENNKLIKVTGVVAGTQIDHPGYYWLCYEWSNLLPSCITCNREGGKNSKFPTIHHYEHLPVFNPHPTLDYASCVVNNNPLMSEQPYILNPEIDDPWMFFTFVIDPKNEGIRIQGTDGLNRGSVTAEICKLNRDDVRYDRVIAVITPIQKTVLAHLKMFIAGRRTLVQFKSDLEGLIQKLYFDATDETLNHTLLRRFIVESSANFNTIVIPFITKRAKRILLTAFQNYTPI